METTPPPTPAPRPLQRFGESAIGKLLMLAILVLLLMVPVSQVRGLIGERMARRGEVEHEITKTWGRSQTLTGPMLVVPAQVAQPGGLIHQPIADAQGQVTQILRRPATEAETIWRSQPLYIMPDELEWHAELVPDTRYRGLFEVVVYEARIRATGTFVVPTIDRNGRSMHWDRAELALGIPDPKGLAEQVRFTWGGEPVDFQPGRGVASMLCCGIHGALGNQTDLEPGKSIPFTLELVLRGSGELLFVPAGSTTSLEATSTWTTPGFVGAFLPGERTVDETGFRAAWHVPSFGRDYPGHWWEGELDHEVLCRSGFGVSLVVSADAYQQNERAVKYAILFVVLTFGMIFLLELLGASRLHAVQYLLVGFALSMFYLLLLALAEHLGFALAYGLAAAATIALIGGYTHAILGVGGAAGGKTIIVSASLGALFTYLYVLLQLEDYALLVGALGLFAALATIMAATRRLDWFSLRFRSTPA